MFDVQTMYGCKYNVSSNRKMFINVYIFCRSSNNHLVVFNTIFQEYFFFQETIWIYFTICFKTRYRIVQGTTISAAGEPSELKANIHTGLGKIFYYYIHSLKENVHITPNKSIQKSSTLMGRSTLTKQYCINHFKMSHNTDHWKKKSNIIAQ